MVTRQSHPGMGGKRHPRKRKVKELEKDERGKTDNIERSREKQGDNKKGQKKERKERTKKYMSEGKIEHDRKRKNIEEIRGNKRTNVKEKSRSLIGRNLSNGVLYENT